MGKIWGYLFLGFFCLITLNLWVLSKKNPSVIFTEPLVSLSQILSLEAVVLLSATLLLTTRFKFLENMFEGLDNVYQLHRILGGIAFVMIINHPLLLAAKTLGQPGVALSYLTPSLDLAYNLGVFSLYGFVLAFIFTVFIGLPYHAWRILHRILGFAFLLGIIHAFLIGSDIANFSPLRVWIFSAVALGVSSLFYTIFLYQKFGPKYDYLVNHIERDLDIINIWLAPVGRVLKFNPGQFVFIKFLRGGLFELHPFSISSGNCEGYIRLSIKILGDYTLKLPELKIGDKATLYGPYGRLGKIYQFGAQNQCWIAGGIGVTPFLSMLRNEAVNQTNRKITFFYCVRNDQEASFFKEICALSQRTNSVQCINWCSTKHGRINAQAIKEMAGEIRDSQILLCGPPQMMESLKTQFLELGVSGENIIYEKFQMP